MSLSPGRSYELGRDPHSDLPVPWDAHISGRHVRIKATADFVEVEKLSTATNPLFFDGQQVDSCRLESLEHFVVGSTSFRVVNSFEAFTPTDARQVKEITFDRKELRKVRYRDAEKRIDVLYHLPGVIWGARTESELFHRLVSLILAGVARAEAAAIVELDENGAARVLHWDRRRETAGEFRPSSRLVEEAIRTRRRSVLNVWESQDSSSQLYTVSAESDWAFCTPVSDRAGVAWGLYVAGRRDPMLFDSQDAIDGNSPLQADALEPEVKFTEFVSELISSVQRLKKMERQQTGLRQFFAPPVLSALGDDFDTGLLEPRECDVTVLFCDLRGFSQRAEEAGDDLIGLLDRVSRALEVMTHHILKHAGVTGDFLGDAALAFWGWPFSSEESSLNACKAALGIRAAFAETRRQKDHPLADFEMGIGVAHGKAVAGKIGTSEQVKVTVFGPVVNLASRLEGMTKQLRVPIVLDEATVKAVSEKLDPKLGRLRTLANVLRYGMDIPVKVSELLPPESQFPELTDEHIGQYEKGVDHFIAGRWEEAYSCLHSLPASDRAQDFLGMMIAEHNRIAPTGWDGVVRLPSK